MKKDLQELRLPGGVMKHVAALAKAGAIDRAQGFLLGVGTMIPDREVEFKLAAAIEIISLQYLDLIVNQQLCQLMFPEGAPLTPEDIQAITEEGLRRFRTRGTNATKRDPNLQAFESLFTGESNGKPH